MHYMTDIPAPVSTPPAPPTFAPAPDEYRPWEGQPPREIRKWAVEQAKAMSSSTMAGGYEGRITRVIAAAALLEAYVMGDAE